MGREEVRWAASMHHVAPHKEEGEDNEVTRRTSTKKRNRGVAQPLIKQEERGDK
jgi:hypothetical protein